MDRDEHSFTLYDLVRWANRAGQAEIELEQAKRILIDLQNENENTKFDPEDKLQEAIDILNFIDIRLSK
jgi:hypothetical protein